MKTLYRYLALALLIVLNTSCLKSGLDELETYDQNDITNIRFEYRWWDETAQRLRVIEMAVTKTIDTKAKKSRMFYQSSRCNQCLYGRYQRSSFFERFVRECRCVYGSTCQPDWRFSCNGYFPGRFLR